MSVWLVRCGHPGLAHNHGFTSIGWDLDVTRVRTIQDVRALYLAKWPGARREPSSVRAIWDFCHTMQVGDFVMMPPGSDDTLWLGKVTGPFAFRPDLPGAVRMTRPVEWLTQRPLSSVDDADLLAALALARLRVKPLRESALTGFPGIDSVEPDGAEQNSPIDIERVAREQIYDVLCQHFMRGALIHVLTGILQARGYAVKPLEKDADDGESVLACDETRGQTLLVRVARGSSTPGIPEGRKVGSTAVRTIRRDMHLCGASRGLLVAWRGFRRNALAEAAQGKDIALRDGEDILAAFIACYERLPAALRQQVALKQIWILAPDSE